MATDFKRILIRRGAGALPEDLQTGEFAFKTDTEQLYIGSDGDPIELAQQVDLNAAVTRITASEGLIGILNADLAETDTAAELLTGRVTSAEGRLDTAEGKIVTAEAHIARTDNPHGVTAAQLSVYTKAEIDAQRAPIRTPLGNVSTDDTAIKFVDYTVTTDLILSPSTILLYSTEAPTINSAAGNQGTLWLNITNGNVYQLTVVGPPEYTWELAFALPEWTTLTDLARDFYYGINGTYFIVSENASTSQGTFINSPTLNIRGLTLEAPRTSFDMLDVIYVYWDSTTNVYFRQRQMIHPNEIGGNDVRDQLHFVNPKGKNVRIKVETLGSNDLIIVFPPDNINADAQEIFIEGISY